MTANKWITLGTLAAAGWVTWIVLPPDTPPRSVAYFIAHADERRVALSTCRHPDTITAGDECRNAMAALWQQMANEIEKRRGR